MLLKARQMTEADLPDVIDIEQRANRFPWSLQNFADCLQAGHHGTVFNDDTGKVQAYTVVQSVLDEIHLLNICVHPDKQGQGWGKYLMKYVIDFACARQAALMVLEVRRSNYRAQHLYSQYGFNEMSVRRAYYPAENGREDAILMGLDLTMLSFFDMD